MSTAAVMEEQINNGERIEMGLQIRGGPRQFVPLEMSRLDPALAFSQGLNSQQMESYFALADRIVVDEALKLSRTIFITSPDAKAGRTSTALNLGWALASRTAGGTPPVLVAEMDLQRPAMRQMLGGARVRYGIDCALRTIATEEESTFTLINDHFHVSAVRDSVKASMLRRLLSEAETFLDWAREQHSWVVVDCPPVLTGRWTKWYRTHAKDTLLVTRAGYTPAVQIRRASKRLGTSLRGVVLNRPEGVR